MVASKVTPKVIHCFLSAMLFSYISMLSLAAKANGVSDLRAALSRLQSSTPIMLDTRFTLFGRTGEHDELIEREGKIELRLEESEKGFNVSYSSAVVDQLHQEELAKLDDENVKNSALNAVGQFDYWEWRELLYPAQQLELALGRYQFLREKNSEWNGRPARELTFSMPKEKVDVKFRKYIKKYKNRMQIWIDDKGVPLASRVIEKGSGRVFIVIGFQFENQVYMEYQQHAGRLVGIKREVEEGTEGATMQSHRHFVTLVTRVTTPGVTPVK